MTHPLPEPPDAGHARGTLPVRLVRKAWHLAVRFVTSLLAKNPTAEELRWVAEILEPGEYALWAAQPRIDLRHTIVVARRVESELIGTPFEGDTQWPAAALLHEVGKVRCDLGVFGRTAATVVYAIAGRSRVAAWSERSGLRGRMGRYVTHGPIGAAMIREAGGREIPAVWAELHHLRWGSARLPERAVEALRRSDR